MSNKTFSHKKSLGQHFLNSEIVPKWMCDAGAVSAGDVVLEIGPGTGALTKELLARGAIVKAVEADDRAIAVLNETFEHDIKEGRLEIALGDMRELSAADVAHIFDVRDHSFKLIANIPYYLSGFLFRTFLESSVQPSDLVFLIQKEVANRIARDKKESLLSLSVKAYGTPTYIKTVSRGHFTPSPKVDSAIVLVSDISRHNFKNIDETSFFELLHLGLRQKRKQLFGNLRQSYSEATLHTLFSEIAIHEKVRGEDLDIQTWLILAKQLLTATK